MSITKNIKYLLQEALSLMFIAEGEILFKEGIFFTDYTLLL